LSQKLKKREVFTAIARVTPVYKQLVDFHTVLNEIGEVSESTVKAAAPRDVCRR
jgi:hypothetical protein